MLLLMIIGVVVAVGIIAAGFLPFNNDNFKKCQHCRKNVKIEAVTCKYCKKDLVELPYR